MLNDDALAALRRYRPGTYDRLSGVAWEIDGASWTMHAAGPTFVVVPSSKPPTNDGSRFNLPDMRQIDLRALRSWAGVYSESEWHEVECPDCEGDGIGSCLSCGHEVDCELCGGSGSVVESDRQHPEPGLIRGLLIDPNLLAMSLACVPDGAATAGVDDGILHIEGDGWRIAIAACNGPNAHPAFEEVPE